MLRIGLLAAGCVIAVAPAIALSADDQALLDRVLLTQGAFVSSPGVL